MNNINNDLILDRDESNLVGEKRIDSIENVKSDLKWFLILSLGLAAIVGIIMSIFNSIGINNFGEFATFMMMVPAGSVVIVKRYVNKEYISEEVNKLYSISLIAMCSSGILVGFGSFISLKMVRALNQSLIAIIGLIGITLIFGKEDKLEKINLSIKKNIKKVVGISLLFLFSKFALLILINALEGSAVLMGEILKIALFLLAAMVLNLLLGWFMFFGEEFGWRAYMQPRLQRLYGKKIGVIVGGVIWGIWHFPLCIMYYGPKAPIVTMVGYLIFCVSLGIFIGYGYMKTGNLWLPILIHLTNNSFAEIVGAIYGKSTKGTIMETLLYGGIILVVYGVFIFSKVYRGNKEEVQIDV